MRHLYLRADDDHADDDQVQLAQLPDGHDDPDTPLFVPDQRVEEAVQAAFSAEVDPYQIAELSGCRCVVCWRSSGDRIPDLFTVGQDPRGLGGAVRALAGPH